MESTDLTIEILRSIRDEIRNTNSRLDQTRTELSERLDQTNSRLDRLERRQTEADVRVSSEIAAMIDTMNDIKVLLRDYLGTTLRDHEQRITRLEERDGA